ncbi:MAG: glycoside hydrolase family 15 protein [Rhodospirillaceae bacterium]
MAAAQADPSHPLPLSDLNLGVIGNCSFNALIDQRACVVWSCMPRPDGDPVFNALLGGIGPQDDRARGVYAVDLENFTSSQQQYFTNTPVLVTRLHDAAGQAVDVIDFAPRFNRFGRRHRPVAIIRIIRPVTGRPRIRIRLRPTYNYGGAEPTITRGSNHVRFVGDQLTLRLTTDAPVTYIMHETWFRLERPMYLFLGPDETVGGSVAATCEEFLTATDGYWRDWVRTLAVPVEWQDAVIRAAITLKMCWYEETGGILAAMTTSIPEAANTGRCWDYRFCWLRDAYYVVRALNRLGAVDIMESYLTYLRNLPELTEDRHMQPVYGLGLEQELTETEVTSLPGYRGMGPVRVGNQAFEHQQHDVYGQVILSSTQAFFDRRLLRPLTLQDFRALEIIGDRAYRLAEVPDAGLWELRTIANVHTYSSVMCWAGCHRLARIAAHLSLADRALFWNERARELKEKILAKAWSDETGAFAAHFGGRELDASLMQMAEVGLIGAEDARFKATLDGVGEKLRRGNHVFRYVGRDDFGVPTTAFNICTFWYIDALKRSGRDDEAREVFVSMLNHRNHVGLLSEDIDPATGELWGNYPQTYSLVGIINGAMRLSRSWRDIV